MLRQFPCKNYARVFIPEFQRTLSYKSKSKKSSITNKKSGAIAHGKVDKKKDPEFSIPILKSMNGSAGNLQSSQGTKENHGNMDKTNQKREKPTIIPPKLSNDILLSFHDFLSPKPSPAPSFTVSEGVTPQEPLTGVFKVSESMNIRSVASHCKVPLNDCIEFVRTLFSDLDDSNVHAYVKSTSGVHADTQVDSLVVELIHHSFHSSSPIFNVLNRSPHSRYMAHLSSTQSTHHHSRSMVAVCGQHYSVSDRLFLSVHDAVDEQLNMLPIIDLDLSDGSILSNAIHTTTDSTTDTTTDITATTASNHTDTKNNDNKEVIQATPSGHEDNDSHSTQNDNELNISSSTSSSGGIIADISNSEEIDPKLERLMDECIEYNNTLKSMDNPSPPLSWRMSSHEPLDCSPFVMLSTSTHPSFDTLSSPGWYAMDAILFAIDANVPLNDSSLRFLKHMDSLGVNTMVVAVKPAHEVLDSRNTIASLSLHLKNNDIFTSFYGGSIPIFALDGNNRKHVFSVYYQLLDMLEGGSSGHHTHDSDLGDVFVLKTWQSEQKKTMLSVIVRHGCVSKDSVAVSGTQVVRVQAISNQNTVMDRCCEGEVVDLMVDSESGPLQLSNGSWLLCTSSLDEASQVVKYRQKCIELVDRLVGLQVRHNSQPNRWIDESIAFLNSKGMLF